MRIWIFIVFFWQVFIKYKDYLLFSKKKHFTCNANENFTSSMMINVTIIIWYYLSNRILNWKGENSILKHSGLLHCFPLASLLIAFFRAPIPLFYSTFSVVNLTIKVLASLISILKTMISVVSTMYMRFKYYKNLKINWAKLNQ